MLHWVGGNSSCRCWLSNIQTEVPMRFQSQRIYRTAHYMQVEHAWNTLKASTPVKLRWIGDAVPGRVVKSSFHLPSSSGDVVGACTTAS